MAVLLAVVAAVAGMSFPAFAEDGGNSKFLAAIAPPVAGSTPISNRAQLEAVKYVENVSEKLFGHFNLTGHSKGGNLAVFAASFCKEKVRKRIDTVYSNDAPGFNNYVIESEGYQKIKPRIKAFIPDASLVGLLFLHDEEYMVVKSEQEGILSHNAYTWCVLGRHFVYAEHFSDAGRFLQNTMIKWINQMDNKQREQFSEGLYTVLSATNAKSIYDLTENTLKNTLLILHKFNNADKETKDIISKTLGQLFEHVTHTLPKLLASKTRESDV
jgi:hypothetical protein